MRRHRFWNVLCHASIVLSGVFLVLFVLDRFNPAMEFLGSNPGDWLLLLFCLSAMGNGCITAAYLISVENRRLQRRQTTTGAPGTRTTTGAFGMRTAAGAPGTRTDTEAPGTRTAAGAPATRQENRRR